MLFRIRICSRNNALSVHVCALHQTANALTMSWRPVILNCKSAWYVIRKNTSTCALKNALEADVCMYHLSSSSPTRPRIRIFSLLASTQARLPYWNTRTTRGRRCIKETVSWISHWLCLCAILVPFNLLHLPCVQTDRHTYEHIAS